MAGASVAMAGASAAMTGASVAMAGASVAMAGASVAMAGASAAMAGASVAQCVSASQYVLWQLKQAIQQTVPHAMIECVTSAFDATVALAPNFATNAAPSILLDCTDDLRCKIEVTLALWWLH